jgi:hypothetical protein
MPTLQELRANVSAALTYRDTLKVGSADWHRAHVVGRTACEAAEAEMRRLLRTDRYGDWRTPNDKMLMLLGYY